MRNLLAAFGIALLVGCLPFEEDGLYACDVDTGEDCETCDAATGWCRNITAIAAGTDKLAAISGAGSNAIWAVGSNGVILRWNGTRWTSEASGTSYGYNAVWAASPNNVYAVGQGGVWSHYDGAGWKTAYEAGNWYWPMGQTDTTIAVGNFTAVGGNASWYTWALDDKGMVGFLAPDGYTIYGATGTPTTLWGAWGDNVGNSYFLGVGGVAIKDSKDNLTWTPSGDPGHLGVEYLTSGTANDLNAVWGDPNGADFWAVGAAGTVIRYVGGAFSSVDAGTTIDLWGVCGTSDSDVFVVGESGIVRHWNGALWSTVQQPYAEALFSVYCNVGDVFAVTSEGAILHLKR